MRAQGAREESERTVVAIALITAVCLLGDMMLYIVLPIYWESFGLSSLWQVGLLLSVNRLVRLPLNPVAGWFYQNMSKQTGVLIAVALAAVTTFSYGYAKSFWLLLTARCFWGAAWSLLRLGGFLTVLDASGEQNRGYLIGRYNGLWGLGGLAGMLAGGLLADRFGIEIAASLFAVLAVCCIPFVIRYVPKRVKQKKESAPSSGKAMYRDLWKQPNIIYVLITGFTVSMVFFGIYMSTLSRMLEVNDAALRLFGFTAGAATLAGFIQAVRWGWDPFLAPLFGKLSDGRKGRMPFLIGSLLLSAGWFILMPFPFPLWLWIGIALCLQLSWTMIITVADSLAADAASRTNKVAAMTAYTLAADVGAALGPSLGYMLTDLFNLSILYWFTSAVLICLCLMWFARRKMFSSV